MKRYIIDKITKLTEEEKEILEKNSSIEKHKYTDADNFIIDSKKLLNDKDIDLRLNTRFVDFPKHSHDYMEFMYVYSGKIKHIIDNQEIVLEEGDLLFLNSHIEHEVKKAEKDDIGINFILSDSFLNRVLRGIDYSSVMYEFVNRSLDKNGEAEYLFFKSKDIYPIRNLMDNLIYSLATGEESIDITSSIVKLLFKYLSVYKDALVNRHSYLTEDVIFKRKVNQYIQRDIKKASLKELADELSYSSVYLSKKIKKTFGKNFDDILKDIRLEMACQLLQNTSIVISDIIQEVGYENVSYFYSLFKEKYGMTLKEYRKEKHLLAN